MKRSIISLTILSALLLTLPQTGAAKPKMLPKTYMFGFSASFTDSLVYFTDIQPVDSVWVDSRTGFLLGRDNYSYQLRDFFTIKRNMPNRVCMVMYDEKIKNLEAKRQQILNKHTTKNGPRREIKQVALSEFKFNPVDMSYSEESEDGDTPLTPELKAAKKAQAKAKAKAQKITAKANKQKAKLQDQIKKAMVQHDKAVKMQARAAEDHAKALNDKAATIADQMAKRSEQLAEQAESRAKQLEQRSKQLVESSQKKAEQLTKAAEERTEAAKKRAEEIAKKANENADELAKESKKIKRDKKAKGGAK